MAMLFSIQQSPDGESVGVVYHDADFSGGWALNLQNADFARLRRELAHIFRSEPRGELPAPNSEATIWVDATKLPPDTGSAYQEVSWVDVNITPISLRLSRDEAQQLLAKLEEE